jgi:hypothetical protein
MHAAIEFVFEHPEIASEWNNVSKHLAVCSCRDGPALLELLDKCLLKGLDISIFREPDLNNEITAIAIEPTLRGKKIVSNLPLTLKNYSKNESL